MGFEVDCGTCGARFNLPGDLYERKVKGRVVTIKCKKCSAPISVDATDLKSGPRQELPNPESWGPTEAAEPPPRSDAGLEMSPTLPMPGTVSEALWLVSFGDHDDREMTLLQIRQALRAGEIDAKTLVWREGMKEWLSLEKVPPLAKLVTKQAADKAALPERKVTTLLGIAPRSADAAPSEPSPISEEPTPLSVEPAPVSEEPTPLSVEPMPPSEAPTPKPAPPVPVRPPPPRAEARRAEPAAVRTAPTPRTAPMPARPEPAAVRADPAPVKEPPRRGPRALSPGLLGFGPVAPPTVSLGPQSPAANPSPAVEPGPSATAKPPTAPRLAGADATTTPQPVPATSTPLPGGKQLPKPPAAKTLPAAFAAQKAAAAAAKATPIAKVELKQRAVAREHPKPPRVKSMAQASSVSEEQAANLDAAAAELDKGNVPPAPDQISHATPADVEANKTLPLVSSEAERDVSSASTEPRVPADTPSADAFDDEVTISRDANRAPSPVEPEIHRPSPDDWDDQPPMAAAFPDPVAPAALVPPTTHAVAAAQAPPRQVDRQAPVPFDELPRTKPVSSGGGRRAAGIVAAAIAAFLVTWFVLRPPSENPSNAPASADQVPEPVPVASVASPSMPTEIASPAPSAEPALAEPIAEPQARSTPEKPAAKTAAAGQDRPERPVAAPTPAPEPAKAAEPSRPAAVKASEPAKAAEPKSGDAPFDKAAALSALSSAASAASSCRKGSDPSGMATVVITFAPSGRVTSANVNGPPFAGTPTGGCIASTMRRAKVPAFSGTHITVSRTVVIQ